MSSSLDEEAIILFGVIADELESFPLLIDLLISLSLTSFCLRYPRFAGKLTLIGGASERNPAILSQSESVTR